MLLLLLRWRKRGKSIFAYYYYIIFTPCLSDAEFFFFSSLDSAYMLLRFFTLSFCLIDVLPRLLSPFITQCFWLQIVTGLCFWVIYAYIQRKEISIILNPLFFIHIIRMPLVTFQYSSLNKEPMKRKRCHMRWCFSDDIIFHFCLLLDIIFINFPSFLFHCFCLLRYYFYYFHYFHIFHTLLYLLLSLWY